MILYNITMKVDWSIHNEWLSWMKDDNIPVMMDAGFFVEYRLLRLMQVDDNDGPTYAVQYIANSIDQYNMFVKNQLDIQCQIERSKWGNKFFSFSTIMEVVQ